MKKPVNAFLRLAAALSMTAIASLANAQAWPAKPVIFVNPFPAGGGTDTFARPIAAQLSKQLGQQFIIENKAGASGTMGDKQGDK